MWSDRVSNPKSLTYESGAMSTALRVPVHAVMSSLPDIIAFYNRRVVKFSHTLAIGTTAQWLYEAYHSSVELWIRSRL